MQNHEPNKLGDESKSTRPAQDLDLEMQQDVDSATAAKEEEPALSAAAATSLPSCVVVVVANDSSPPLPSNLPAPDSPTKPSLSRVSSSHDHCRVCQQDKEEEVLIDLGCKCKGGLAKSHRSCIDAWFLTRGSNKCEICQEIAVNVSPPESQPSTNYWVWRLDPTYRPRDRERGCSNPLWVAFSILIGGLLLDVLISITLGVSALPVNIIIGVIVVIGLGTALRLALEFCHEWSSRRGVHRVDANVNLGYHPTL